MQKHFHCFQYQVFKWPHWWNIRHNGAQNYSNDAQKKLRRFDQRSCANHGSRDTEVMKKKTKNGLPKVSLATSFGLMLLSVIRFSKERYGWSVVEICNLEIKQITIRETKFFICFIGESIRFVFKELGQLQILQSQRWKAAFPCININVTGELQSFTESSW